MATKMNGYTEGHVRQNTSPSTQQINSGLGAMKTYGNAESRSGRKMDGDAEGCNQECTSVRSGWTPV